MGLGAVLSESVYKYCYVLRILRAILCCFSSSYLVTIMAVIAQKTKTKFDDLSVSNKKRLKYMHI
jgi:hypothetical protein